MSVIYLFVYILMFSFGMSALSGIVMFVMDIIRYGKPHTKFECSSSIEAYNESLKEKSEKPIESVADSVNIDLWGDAKWIQLYNYSMTSAVILHKYLQTIMKQ